MAEKIEKMEYRLLGPRFYITIEGEKKVYTRGELVPLTATQAVAFKDQFEPKDAKKKRSAETKAAKEKVAADKKAADNATERRAQDLEEQKKAEADKAEADKAEADKATTNPPTPNANPQDSAKAGTN